MSNEALNFLQQVSSQTESDINVPKFKLGYIDYDFVPATYPQVLPRVTFDGQGLSTIGYKCLNSYDPYPGNRVLLMPVGTSYVIAGAIDNYGVVASVQKAHQNFIYPGTLMFSTTNHGTSQSVAAGTGGRLDWASDSLTYDPYEFWNASSPTLITPTIAGWYTLHGSIVFPTASTGSRRVTSEFNGSAGRSSYGVMAAATGSEPTRVRIPSKTWEFNGLTDYVRFLCSVTGTASGTFPGGVDSSQVELFYAGSQPLLVGDEDIET